MLDMGKRRRRRPIVDVRQNCSHRHALPYRDSDLRNRSFMKDLDLDRPLLGFDDCDDAAGFHFVAGFDQPFDESAGLHIGAQSGHAVIDHDGETSSRAAAAIPSGCGKQASSRCAA